MNETFTTPMSVADARDSLSRTLRRFRAHPQSAPLVLGSHRIPEAVLMPYSTFSELVAARSNVPTMSVLQGQRGLILRLAQANNVKTVAVFGSVARGEATEKSDIDLLVEPDAHATLFDLAQLELDLELLLGSPVHVVSRNSLDPVTDGGILESVRQL